MFNDPMGWLAAQANSLLHGQSPTQADLAEQARLLELASRQRNLDPSLTWDQQVDAATASYQPEWLNRDFNIGFGSQAPMLGVPILGHIANIAPALWGNLTTQDPLITAPTSSALEYARQHGAMKTWQDRSDIHPVAKMGAEMVTPMGPLDKAFSWSAKAALGLGAQAKKLPVISYLAAPHATAKINEAVEQTHTLANRLKHEIIPDDFVTVTTAMRNGIVGVDDIASRIGEVGSRSLGHWRTIADTLGESTLTRLKDEAATPDDFWTSLVDEVGKATAAKIGYKGALGGSALAQGYRQTNQTLREAALSGGFTAIPNVAGGIAGSMLEGIGPGRIAKDAWELATTGAVKETRDFLGVGGLPVELGLRENQIIGGAAAGAVEDSAGLVSRSSLPQAMATGMGIGGLSGGPAGLATGAAAGALTKLLFTYGMKGQQFAETALRSRHFMEGAKKYLQTVDWTPLRSISPEIDQAVNVIQAQGYAVSPQRFKQVLDATSQSNPAIWEKARRPFLDIYDEAIGKGLENVNRTQFAYTRDSNFLRGLRQYTPFPVWATKNVPYYLQKTVERPAIGRALLTYAGDTERNRARAGLPGRFAYKAPIMPLAGGTLYANPISPLSISSQLQPPPPENGNAGGLEPIDQMLGQLGLAPMASITYPLQTLGLVNQGQEFQSFFPNVRLVESLAQAATGHQVPTDAALKAPFEFLRSRINPEAAGRATNAEYNVQKRIAELALQRTGKGWWDTPEYAEAMGLTYQPVTDDIQHLMNQVSGRSQTPAEAIREEAERSVGTEQAALYAGRRLIPFQLAFLPDTEKDIRKSRAALEASGRLVTPKSYAVWKEKNPTAFGYSGIGEAPNVMNLKGKLAAYQTMSTENAAHYRNGNPDLDAYLTWWYIQASNNREADVDTYLTQ